ncbi:hypothetical protein EMIT0357P_40231 [Pseudomonas marginalis]
MAWSADNKGDNPIKISLKAAPQGPCDDLSFSHDTVKMRFMTHRSLNCVCFVQNLQTIKSQKRQRPALFPERAA